MNKRNFKITISLLIILTLCMSLSSVFAETGSILTINSVSYVNASSLKVLSYQNIIVNVTAGNVDPNKSYLINAYISYDSGSTWHDFTASYTNFTPNTTKNYTLFSVYFKGSGNIMTKVNITEDLNTPVINEMVKSGDYVSPGTYADLVISDLQGYSTIHYGDTVTFTAVVKNGNPNSINPIQSGIVPIIVNIKLQDVNNSSNVIQLSGTKYIDYFPQGYTTNIDIKWTAIPKGAVYKYSADVHEDNYFSESNIYNNTKVGYFAVE